VGLSHRTLSFATNRLWIQKISGKKPWIILFRSSIVGCDIPGPVLIAKLVTPELIGRQELVEFQLSFQNLWSVHGDPEITEDAAGGSELRQNLDCHRVAKGGQ
jgi:hypothetical protein